MFTVLIPVAVLGVILMLRAELRPLPPERA